MPKQNQKTVPYPVRLTEQEADAFKAYAEQCGIGRATLVRQFIRERINQSPDLIDTEITEFRKAVTQLSAIGRNLNQITKAANAGKIPTRLTEDTYIHSLVDHVANVKQTLQDYLVNTRNRLVKPN